MIQYSVFGARVFHDRFMAGLPSNLPSLISADYGTAQYAAKAVSVPFRSIPGGLIADVRFPILGYFGSISGHKNPEFPSLSDDLVKSGFVPTEPQ